MSIATAPIRLSILVCAVCLFSGCQTSGFALPGAGLASRLSHRPHTRDASMRDGHHYGNQNGPMPGSRQSACADPHHRHYAGDDWREGEAPLDYPSQRPFVDGLETAHPPHMARQAGYQEAPRRAYAENARPYSARQVRQPPRTVTPPMPGPESQTENMLRENVRPEDVRPKFYPDEYADVLPQSATERVIELSSEVALLRQELNELHANIERLQMANNELRQQREQQGIRLANLESELQTARESEASARSQFATLVQRVELFNDRRQRQIADLHAIIDQLEQHLRQGTTTPTTVLPGNTSVQPYNEPPVNHSQANPYRQSTGNNHVQMSNVGQ
ncbi:MAG: hypothetical protein ACR2NP_22625 [Pirellulaceae bacterium]